MVKAKNKEESESYINIAYAYLRIGDLTKAQEFAIKAGKFNRSTRVRKLKAVIAKKLKGLGDGDSSSQQEDKTRFSQEHLDAVNRVNNCNTLYEVLQISRDSTDTDIKRSFRKIALILHPDKNNVPGAEEVFKVVNNAIGLLTNLEKRRIYNSFLDKVAANLFYGHDPQGYPPKWWCDASEKTIQAMENCLNSGYQCQNPDCERQRRKENDAKQQQREETRRQNFEEARKRTEEEARKHSEEEARKRQEEARHRQEEARRQQEQARRQQEQARKRSEEEARKRSEEEARHRQEEARRQQEQARRQQEQARKRSEEEARKRSEVEARKRQEEARRQQEESRRRAEAEARRKYEEQTRKGQSGDKWKNLYEEEVRRREEVEFLQQIYQNDAIMWKSLFEEEKQKRIDMLKYKDSRSSEIRLPKWPTYMIVFGSVYYYFPFIRNYAFHLPLKLIFCTRLGWIAVLAGLFFALPSHPSNTKR